MGEAVLLSDLLHNQSCFTSGEQGAILWWISGVLSAANRSAEAEVTDSFLKTGPRGPTMSVRFVPDVAVNLHRLSGLLGRVSTQQYAGCMGDDGCVSACMNIVVSRRTRGVCP